MSEQHHIGEGRRRPQNMSEALRLLSSVIRPKGDPPGAHPKLEFINTKTAAQWLGIPERSMQQYVQMGSFRATSSASIGSSVKTNCWRPWVPLAGLPVQRF